MANFITSIRIFCSLVLLFCPIFSTSFYVFYIVSGITDMIDGTVARKTNTVTEFGSKMDTVADFIFLTVNFIKLIPVLNISILIYVWVVVIAIIKVTNIIVGLVIYKKLIVAHTILNKITGGLLFLLPLTFKLIELRYSIVIVCLVATISAIQEGYCMNK